MPIRSRARSPQAQPGEQLLPETEMEVLAVLQARGEADAREIREVLAAWRPMTHASVLTLLGRLEAKELVARRKSGVGKSFVYFPTRRSGRIHRTLLRRILRRIFSNDPASLVASLFDAKVPTKDELQQIRDLVDEIERRKR